MKRKIFAVMLSCALIGSLFGCGSDKETVVTNSDLIAESATGSVTESTATDETSAAITLDDLMLDSVATMTDVEATKLLGGMYKMDIYEFWGEPEIKWDESDVTDDYLACDQWSYCNEDFTVYTAVTVYYNPADNFETVREVNLSANDVLLTTDVSGLPLTESTITGFSEEEVMAQISSMTRHGVLNLLGQPWGYVKGDPHTEIWKCMDQASNLQYTVSITFDSFLSAIPQSCHIAPPTEEVEYVPYQQA